MGERLLVEWLVYSMRLTAADIDFESDMVLVQGGTFTMGLHDMSVASPRRSEGVIGNPVSGPTPTLPSRE